MLSIKHRFVKKMLAYAWCFHASVLLLPAQTNHPVTGTVPTSGSDTNECKTPTSRASLFKQLGASPFTAKTADASFAYDISPKSHWQIKATKVPAKTAAASFFQVQLEVTDTLTKQSHNLLLDEPFAGQVEISVQPEFALVLGATRDGYRAAVIHLSPTPKSGTVLPVGLPDGARKLSNVYWSSDQVASFVVEQGAAHSHALMSLQVDAAALNFKPVAAQPIAWQSQLKSGIVPQEAAQKISYEITGFDPVSNTVQLISKPTALFQTDRLILPLLPPAARASH